MEKTLELLVKEVMEADDFTEEVKQSAESVIIDTLIATLYGLKTEEELKKMMEDKHVERGISIPGTDYQLNTKDALLVLGTATVANELDEGNTFAKGHPSAHILPVVYTAALERDYNFGDIIIAYVKGYEIAVRLSSAFQMKDSMHPHGTWGNVGGAVAKALLEHKTNEEIVKIIYLTLSLPLATNWLAAEKGQTVRNLYTGYGNVIAYDAVDLVEYGFVSNNIVAGDLWGNIMGTNVNEEKLLEKLFDPPMIHQNYFKVYPTCRFTHAAIEAATNAVNDNEIQYEEINHITINTYNLAARCDAKEIETRLESKFSIPYAVSCIVIGLNLYDDYESNLIKIGNFINKVDVVDSDEMTALLPSKRAAECIITVKDGTQYKAMINNAQGEFSNPFTQEELKEKYRNLLKNHYDFDERWLENLVVIDRNLSFKEWLVNNKLLRSGHQHGH